MKGDKLKGVYLPRDMQGGDGVLVSQSRGVEPFSGVDGNVNGIEENREGLPDEEVLGERRHHGKV